MRHTMCRIKSLGGLKKRNWKNSTSPKCQVNRLKVHKWSIVYESRSDADCIFSASAPSSRITDEMRRARSDKTPHSRCVRGRVWSLKGLIRHSMRQIHDSICANSKKKKSPTHFFEPKWHTQPYVILTTFRVGVERRERASPQRERGEMETLGALRMHVRVGSYLNTFQLLRGSRSEIIETMLAARAARALLGQNAVDWVSEWALLLRLSLCTALSVISAENRLSFLRPSQSLQLCLCLSLSLSHRLISIRSSSV